MTVRAEGIPQRIPRAEAMQFLFHKDLPPILRVKPGESFVVETEDALSGMIRSNDRLPIPVNVPTPSYFAARTEPGCRTYLRGGCQERRPTGRHHRKDRCG